MKKTLTAMVATVLTVLMSGGVQAQLNQLQTTDLGQPAQIQPTQPTQPQAAVVGVQPQQRVAPYVAPPAQNKYHFGMQLQLIRGYAGTTLRVVSVTPGSPAYYAGLEYGDEIRTVNGQGFGHARDSFEAVAMMNRYVDAWISQPGPAPAVAATASATVATTYYPPAPSAQMVVRNVRNGQDVFVTVRPTIKGWSGTAPAAPAQASPAVSTALGR